MHGNMKAATGTDQARPKPKHLDDRKTEKEGGTFDRDGWDGRDGRDERNGWESECRGCRVALGLNWEVSQLISSSSSVASVI